MKIIFMGTPDFALEPLRALIAAGHEIKAVLTKEDKPRNRGYEMHFTPVKEEALRQGILVLQPKTLKDAQLWEKLRKMDADLFVVVAYGKILPKEVLEIPPLGCINIHASLLPAYRGAAPIQWAIIRGEKKTGITTMLMDEGLDTGDILKQYEIEIAQDETGGTLFEKLAKLGGEAITDTLRDLEAGRILPRRQGEASTEYAKTLNKEMGQIDFSKSAAETERWIRGLNPWPCAYSFLKGRLLKIWRAAPVSGNLSPDTPKELSCGSLIAEGGRLYVVCGKGWLEILELQLEGKKRMDAASFLRGFDIEGCRLERRE
ncbi:MAG: methionyl-tRNA formyltransferase [Johnsonella sp.]|nr:methionyl-tRNA formyltransferase [Johnsonella sp.]